MTARNPLFEFMPYGAPELLAAQRTHMVRALAFASGLALAAFMIVNALGLRLPDRPPIEIQIPDHGSRTIEPPPSIQRNEPVAARFTAPAKANPLAIPRPVPDALAPIERQAPPVEGGTPNGVVGGTPQAHEAPPGPVAAVDEPLPDINRPFYVDELPAVVKSIDPVYPDLAREAGIEGRVYVHMLVGKDGRVVRAEIDPKFSVLMLDTSALEAARKWVFKPGFVNQHPVAVWVGQMFSFTLHR